MGNYFIYQHNDSFKTFGILNNCIYSRIEFPGLFIIDCFKFNDRHYSFNAFLYDSKYIFVSSKYSTKFDFVYSILSFLQVNFPSDLIYKLF